MKLKWLRRWVKALRSGEYGFQAERLRTDAGYSPLGVLCDLVDPGGWTRGGAEHHWYFDGIYRGVPPGRINWTTWLSIERESFFWNATPNIRTHWDAADWIEDHVPSFWQRWLLRRDPPPNHLRGASLYMAGPIDACPQGGSHWRERLTPFLREIGVLIYNPLSKSLDMGLEDDDARVLRKQLREQGDWDRLGEIMRTIRVADLQMVDKADFVLCYLDLDASPCGTFEELFWANRLKRHCIVWCPQGKERVPDWIFGTLDHNLFFSTEAEVKCFLASINGRGHPDPRWLFFRPS